MIARQNYGREQGFSLVEVALALGIVALALLSIVGLLGSAIDTGAEAGKETALASMAGQVMVDLRGVPFDALAQASPRAAASDPAALPVLVAGTPLADSAYFFTVEGTPLAGPGPEAHYQCVVRKAADESSKTVSDETINRTRVVLHFTWPVPAHADPLQRPGSSLFNASIARY